MKAVETTMSWKSFTYQCLYSVWFMLRNFITDTDVNKKKGQSQTILSLDISLLKETGISFIEPHRHRIHEWNFTTCKDYDLLSANAWRLCQDNCYCKTVKCLLHYYLDSINIKQKNVKKVISRKSFEWIFWVKLYMYTHLPKTAEEKNLKMTKHQAAETVVTLSRSTKIFNNFYLQRNFGHYRLRQLKKVWHIKILWETWLWNIKISKQNAIQREFTLLAQLLWIMLKIKRLHSGPTRINQKWTVMEKLT